MWTPKKAVELDATIYLRKGAGLEVDSRRNAIWIGEGFELQMLVEDADAAYELADALKMCAARLAQMAADKQKMAKFTVKKVYRSDS